MAFDKNIVLDLLSGPIDKVIEEDCDPDAVWKGFGGYVVECYQQYHVTKTIRIPSNGFMADLNSDYLANLVDMNVLKTSFLKLVQRYHHELGLVASRFASQGQFIIASEAQLMMNGVFCMMILFKGARHDHCTELQYQ